MGLVFLLFCMPGNLWLDARHYEFSVLETEYFCIFVSLLCFILECSEVPGWWLGPFRSSCYALWGRSIDVPGLRLGILHGWDDTFLRALPSALWIRNFSSLASGNRHHSQLCVSPATVLLTPFEGSSPQPHVLLSHACTTICCWGPGETLQISGVLCLRSSLLLGALSCFLSASVYLISQLCLLNSGSLPSFACSSSLCSGNSRDSELRQWTGSPHHFLRLRDDDLHCQMEVLKAIVSSMLSSLPLGRRVNTARSRSL